MASKQPSKSISDILDQTTIISLLSTVAILGTAYFASVRLLPRDSSTKVRILFVWHAFDALIHAILEGGFLYNCFFSWTDRPTTAAAKLTSLPGTISTGASAYLSPNVFFLGREDRLYGSLYGTNPLSALWRVYAQADARWGGSDLTVISLELLTVFIGAPLAAWICYCLVARRRDAWFWMVALATGELYGGFMTFAPEWLSGNPNLDTSNWVYLWLYLTFFNMLWVFLPAWILWEGYEEFVAVAGKSVGGKKKK